MWCRCHGAWVLRVLALLGVLLSLLFDRATWIATGVAATAAIAAFALPLKLNILVAIGGCRGRGLLIEAVEHRRQPARVAAGAR